MYSLYERDDYPREARNAGQAMDACRQVLRVLAQVDVVRAISWLEAMHVQSAHEDIPDDRTDFSHQLAVLDAARPLWLLARFAARHGGLPPAEMEAGDGDC